mmetsp:Transcript_40660/g.86489  ORF Transcript_40660/g.86489 Transcript_40660/m.86489 type:complete len:203 (-) Transcript_40660:2141-2749(-)
MSSHGPSIGGPGQLRGTVGFPRDFLRRISFQICACRSGPAPSRLPSPFSLPVWYDAGLLSSRGLEIPEFLRGVHNTSLSGLSPSALMACEVMVFAMRVRLLRKTLVALQLGLDGVCVLSPGIGEEAATSVLVWQDNDGEGMLSGGAPSTAAPEEGKEFPASDSEKSAVAFTQTWGLGHALNLFAGLLGGGPSGGCTIATLLG